MQTRGNNILIDPVWSERASPFSFVGPKRVNAPGIAFDDLPKIDARAGHAQSLRPHGRADHRAAWQRIRPRIVTPLGNDTILKGAVPDLDAPTRGLGRRRSSSATASSCTSSRRSTGRRAARATAVRRCGRASSCRPARRRSTTSAIPASATAPRSRACADAIRSRAGAPADRRLRAALVHAQSHMNPDEAVQRFSCAAPRGVRASLGHVPAHQRNTD